MSSVQSSLNIVLEHLRPDQLNDDTAKMLQSAWKTAGLKIGIIHDLLRIRVVLQKTSNPELNNNLKQLKIDLVDYLTYKMKMGTTPLDDLIFEIEEIAKLRLDESAQGRLNRAIDISPLLTPNQKDKLNNAFRRNQLDLIPVLIEQIRQSERN